MLLARKVVITGLLSLGLCGLCSFSAWSMELKGDIAVEGRLFSENGAYPHQNNQSCSGAANLELYHDITDNFSINLKGFYRADSEDSERSHGDIRLAEMLYYTDSWEIAVGAGRVFWGATEFVHLVDIINQTDLIESLDGEEKFGQPMLHLTIPNEWGVVEAFVLPLFRKRSFAGQRGRFRTPFLVDTDAARYESGSRQYHLDVALRYSTTFSSADIGIAHFIGTGREPALLAEQQPDAPPVLIPYYEQIAQTSLDLQWSAGDWLIKGEALYRSGQSRSFMAVSGGFEYTFSSLGGSLMDLGVIGEYVFDDRNQGWIATIYDNDIMAGLRLAVNDLDDSTVLLGVIRDVDYDSTIITVDASRRLGDSVRINLDAALFLDMDPNDPASSLSRDTSMKLELVWYW